jgi:thiol-disulfide isomerase/thioredoxin
MMRNPRPRNPIALALLRATLVLALLPLGAGTLQAQNENLLKGFKLVAEFVLEIDGQRDAGAEIYLQRAIPAYLVLPSSASPVLLVPRTQSIQAVHIMKISRAGHETLDLAPDAIYANRGSFRLDGTAIAFDLDGHRYVLKEKPALLGVKGADDLEAYDAKYVALAEAYDPSAEAMARLRGETRPITVRVYFGSWCPFCQQYVPRIVRVGRELEGTKVTIDYYGLPQDFNDPITKQLKVERVPTAIVYLAGKEAGRLTSEDWRSPEQAILKLIGG